MSSTLTLEPAADGDFVALFTILSLSFGHEHPYIDIVFPAHETEAGRVAGGERLLAGKKADPNAHYLKVVDSSIADESERIVGFAQWNVYDNLIPDDARLEGDYWATAEDKELAQYLFWEYFTLRRKALRASKGRLCALNLMCIDPRHQRRGAGKMLVKWGTDEADRLGVEAVVEASNQGKGLYEHFNFQPVSHIAVDYPPKWAGREKQEFWWMIRPRAGKGEISDEMKPIR